MHVVPVRSTSGYKRIDENTENMVQTWLHKEDNVIQLCLPVPNATALVEKVVAGKSSPKWSLASMETTKKVVEELRGNQSLYHATTS